MKLVLGLTLLAAISMPTFAAPFIVAHRGASGEAPENTLAAYKLAWEQGADAIEGDFHLTKDGVIVSFHDRNTKKRCGVDLEIRTSTHAELSKLDVGKWKAPKFAGLRMPTLGQVLATVPKGKAIYIEIKCGPEAVPALLTDVEESGLKDDQIVVISFNESVIAAVKKSRPQWTANWLVGFDLKDPSDLDTQLPQVLKTLKKVGADGLGSNAHPAFTRKHVEQLRTAGFAHHVWTVNDPVQAQAFLKIGTQSITTDFPGSLR